MLPNDLLWLVLDYNVYEMDSLWKHIKIVNLFCSYIRTRIWNIVSVLPFKIYPQNYFVVFATQFYNTDTAPVSSTIL